MNPIPVVRARVPASSANLGPGFDVHSIALQTPEIEVQLSTADTGTRRIESVGAYARDVSGDPNVNAAGKALETLRQAFGKPEGYSLRIKVEIPPRKGLGLSGAEAVGAVVCANGIFELGLTPQIIAQLASTAEPSNHMDNVTASTLGGFNIVSRIPLSEHPVITNLPPPRDLGVAVIVPNVEKASTEAARQVLPNSVPREAYVKSMSYTARLSAAFATKDVAAILETLPWDGVVEPARADGGVYGKGVTSQFLLEEKKILLQRFHVAETISGAGPSRALWYRIAEDRKVHRRDRAGMIKPAIDFVSERLRALGHDIQEIFLTKPSANGAKVISRA